MKCPSCHFEQPDAHTACECCGLIFAKYQPELFEKPKASAETPEKIIPPELMDRIKALGDPEWETHHIDHYTWKSATTELRAGNEDINPKSLDGKLLMISIVYITVGFFLAIPFFGTRIYFFYLQGSGLLFGSFFFVRSFSELWEKRLMEDIPFSTIRAMAPGQVEISGQASGPAPFQTPFTQKPCVYYDYLIEQYVQEGKNSRWAPVDNGGSPMAPFTIDDGTGKALIQPEGANTLLSVGYSLETRNSRDIPDPIRGFMEAKGGTAIMNQHLRFTEKSIEPRQTVFVMGMCQLKDGPGEGDERGIFVGKGARPGDVFVISDKGRGKVERQFTLKALGYLLWGLGFIGVSLYFFLKAVLK